MLTYASGGGAGGAGAGDVVGPASSTDNAIARFDTTTGKLIQDSAVSISDAAANSVTLATVPGASPGLSLVVEATEPAAAAGASVAGRPLTINAGDAVASTDTAGAAAGGDLILQAGAAARNTSGNAIGGIAKLASGAGIGTGRAGDIQILAGAPGSSTDGAIRSGTGTSVGTYSRALFGHIYGQTLRVYRTNYTGYGNAGGPGSDADNPKILITEGATDFGVQFARNAHGLKWSASNNAENALDTGLTRAGVGLAKFTDASTGIGGVYSSRPVLPEITSPETIAVTDSRKAITNEGAGGAVTYNLPAAAAGLEYIFIVQATQNMVVTAASGDTIRVAAGVSSAGGTATNGTIGSTLHILAINATEWIAIAAPNGTWTLA